jgi:hypothetical protein
VLAALLATACTKNQPRCFECGLTDEWARAEREEQERAAREDADNQAQLKAAIAAGTDEELVFDAIFADPPRYLELITAELERGTPPQPELLLHQMYDYLVRYPDSDAERQQARERIFVLVAASRGEAARPLLETCATTALAPRCAEVLATIAPAAPAAAVPQRAQ